MTETLLEMLGRDEPEWSDWSAISTMWPPYRTQDELDRIRRASRWLAVRHPFAIAALEVRASYVVGTGHRYTVRPKDGQEIEPNVLTAIQAEITEFTERNQWFHRQRDNQMRMDRDGELFLRMFDVDGYLVVRYIEPELVASPVGDAGPGNLFGLVLDPQDAETVRAYTVRRPDRGPSSYEEVPADQVQHRRSTIDTALPRGIPIFWAVEPNLRRVWKLLRNMTTVASIQAAVAFVRQHERTSGSAIQQYLARTGATPGERPKDVETIPPGAIIDLEPGVKAEFPSSSINVGNFTAAVQAELRAVAARLSMPEYMLSGDASNANYASTLVAEAPAIRTFERLQAEMLWYDTQLLSRALQLAELHGRLPEGVHQQVVIDGEAPTVAVRDRLKEVQADQLLLTMQLVSPQTIAARYGYDYSQERKLIDQAETGQLE
jgi:capsid protein